MISPGDRRHRGILVSPVSRFRLRLIHKAKENPQAFDLNSNTGGPRGHKLARFRHLHTNMFSAVHYGPWLSVIALLQLAECFI